MQGPKASALRSAEYFNDVKDRELLYSWIFFQKCLASAVSSETNPSNTAGGAGILSRITSPFLQQLSNRGLSLVLGLLRSSTHWQCWAWQPVQRTFILPKSNGFQFGIWLLDARGSMLVGILIDWTPKGTSDRGSSCWFCGFANLCCTRLLACAACYSVSIHWMLMLAGFLAYQTFTTCLVSDPPSIAVKVLNFFLLPTPSTSLECHFSSYDHRDLD